jgi:hypothetical protein
VAIPLTKGFVTLKIVFGQRLIFAFFIIFVTGACAAPRQMLPPQQAQAIVTGMWQADQHIVWELDWPAAPVGGPLTVESWRAGERYRFEILEAAAPALRGETLVFDGQQGWRYNRFAPPAAFSPVSPALPPVSDAFNRVEQLLQLTPETASQTAAQLDSAPAQEIELAFANGDKLTAWRDLETGLPRRIVVRAAGQELTLRAREIETLANAPPEIFGVGDWINNLR